MRRVVGTMRTMSMLGLVWITMHQPRFGYGYAFSPRHQAISSVIGSRYNRRHRATHHVACLPTKPATCYKQEHRRTVMIIDRKMDILSRVHADPVDLVRWFRDLGGHVGNIHFKECPGKGWGFRASQDLEEGETLLVLPSKWCIALSPTHRRHAKDMILTTRKKSKKNANGDGHWNQLTAEGSDAAATTVTSQPYWMVPPPLVSLIDMVPPEFEDIRLGLVLLAERYKVGGSAWWPYLRNLPHSVVGIPLCSFDNAEMAALQDDVVRQKVDARSAFLLKFVKDVLDGIPPGPYSPFGDERVTIGKLAWAAAVASSRAFRFDERLQLVGGVATAEGDPVIVPFIDMVNVNVEDGEGVNVKVEAVSCNEESEAETRADRQVGKDRAIPAGSVRLVATRAIGKNESLEMAPVCIIRDAHVNTIGNQELLCNYGFVDGGSRQERASIEFSKNVLQYARLLVCITNEKFGSSVGENELEPWQHRVLIDLKLEGPGADRTVYLGGDRSHATLPVDPRLLAALRVMYARSKEELQGKSAQELADYETGKLSTYNERRVLSLLNGLINMLKWKTTLEDDEMLLYGRKVTPDLLEHEEAISSLWHEDSTAKDSAVPKSGEGDEEEAREYSFDMNANGRSDLICRPKLALDALNSRLEADMAGDIVGDAATAAAADEEDDGHDDNQELHGKDGRGRKNSKPLKINSELSANMVLAVKYRLAQKRSMREVALILRAQLAQIGLVKGMRFNPSLGSTLQAVADNAAVTES